MLNFVGSGLLVEELVYRDFICFHILLPLPVFNRLLCLIIIHPIASRLTEYHLSR